MARRSKASGSSVTSATVSMQEVLGIVKALETVALSADRTGDDRERLATELERIVDRLRSPDAAIEHAPPPKSLMGSNRSDLWTALANEPSKAGAVSIMFDRPPNRDAQVAIIFDPWPPRPGGKGLGG